MKRCDSNEHYFDDSKHTSCPFCVSDRENNDKTKVFGNEDNSNKTKVVGNEDVANSNNQINTVSAHNTSKVEQQSSTSDAPKTQVNWGKKKKTNPQTQEGNNTSSNNEESNQDLISPVVGWLVVIQGNGLGSDLKIIPGMNTIGRDNSNNISIDFGDMSISRKKHCTLIFDYKNSLFFLTHNESSNLSYLNDGVVLQPTNLKANDIIGIGDTKLRFIPFCDNDFSWD